MDTPEPAAQTVQDAPTAPDDELSDEQKLEAKARADAMEALMLEVQRDEADWALNDRLDWLRCHGA